MKTFIKKIGLFILPIIVTAIVISFGTKYILQTKYSTSEPEIDYLFAGHSQPECAINDTLIPRSLNVSQGGEAFFYTYQKLKKIIPENPQLKAVFISFSNNQIEEKMDDWTFGETHLNQYFAKYQFLMNGEDLLLVLKKTPKYFIQANIAALESNLKTIVKRQKITKDRNWGGYLPINQSKLDSLKKVDYIETIKKQNHTKLSAVNIDYLKKIVLLCKTNHTKIIFIRTPYDEDLKQVYNENLFQKIRISNFKEIPFWDFRDADISFDGFLDYDHLNQKGAKEFSILLKTEIEQIKNN